MDKNKTDRVYLGISELGRDNTESGVKSIQGFLSGTQEQENHIFFWFFNEIKTKSKVVSKSSSGKGVPVWC